MRSPPGNEGWSGQEGLPPGSSVTKERLTPVEGGVLPRSPGARSPGVDGGEWAWPRLVFKHASLPLGSHPPVDPSGIHGWDDSRRMPVLAQPVLGQRGQVVTDSPIRMGGSSPSLVPPVSGAR